MISKVTESNKELIDARIVEINKALAATGSSTRIANLEEYYANIVEISQLSTNFQNAPYKFFLMPLDEPMFEIDANKRSISVPTVFSKNGVGVYGDHMAEVLYFKIDRYFDYQDLFNVDNIIINWQFRPSNSSRNTVLETYTSYALAPDDTYDPGHIVFGWVIGNFIDKDGKANYMTHGKGVLTFSVSFLKREGDKYKYLFSTQTASVNINDTLVLDNPNKLDSLRHPIFDRLSNSRYTPENITPLTDPIFRSGDIGADNSLLGLPLTANFEFNNDGTEADSLKLEAIGKVYDDGNVTYSWSGTKFASGNSIHTLATAYDPTKVYYVLNNDFYSVADPQPTSDDDFTDDKKYYLGGEGAPAYVLTKDTAPQPHITYYTFTDDEYIELNEDEITNAFADVNTPIYEAGNSFNVTESGDYMVTLQSVKTVEGSTVKSGNISSCACSVPLAAVPKVTLSAQGLKPKEKNEDGTVVKKNYEIFDPEEAAKWTFISSTAPEVTATISIDESKIWNVEEQTGVRGVTAGSKIGLIALKMTEKAGDEGKPTAAEIANMSFEKYNDAPIIINNNNANVEGTYKVYAVNKRNHTYNVSDASNELKTSLVAPILSQINVEMEREGDENLVLISNNARTEDATIVITTANPSRNFIISIGDDLTHVESLEVKVLEIYEDDYEANPSIITYLKDREEDPDLPNFYEPKLIEGSNNQFKFSISGDPGYFVVELTTKYHGTQNVTITAPFNITSSSNFNS